MKKLYFILGFTLLTTNTFAQWQELVQEDNINSDFKTNWSNFIELTEDNQIYALFTTLNYGGLGGQIQETPNSLELMSNFSSSAQAKFKKYSGSFSDVFFNDEISTRDFGGNTVVNISNAIASSNNMLYVASAKPYNWGNPSDRRLTVYKYDGGWQTVGSPEISEGSLFGTLCLTFDPFNSPNVFYQDYTEGMRIKRFDGANWVNLGAVVPSIVSAYPVNIDFSGDGIAYVANSDNGASNGFMIRKYNGSTQNWDDLSSSTISSGSSKLFDMVVANNMPYVAFWETGNTSLQIKRFNGTNWELVGNTNPATAGINPGSYAKIKKTSSGIIYVAYSDYLSQQISIKRLIGNDWVSVGTAGFSGKVNSDDFDFDVNDSNNCALIFRTAILQSTPKIFYFDGSTLATGTVETGKTFDIKAYPNPVSNTLNIDTNLTINNIVIYNELGQFVFETKLKTIDTSGLSSGLYFVKVKTEEGTSYRTVKIIKK